MPVSALRRRVQTIGPQPFFIHYDGQTGSRIELSGTTFGNWVDKTCNFLDTLDVDPQEQVRLELALTAPGHWVTSVWAAAIWQRACSITVDETADAQLVVAGPEAVAEQVTTVACSLHPLGAAFAQVPEGCIDYAEVLSEPDVPDPQPSSADQVAWDPDVTFGDLAKITPRSDRQLFVDPAPGWQTIRELLVAPLLGDGSTVVITGADPELVERVRATERVSD